MKIRKAIGAAILLSCSSSYAAYTMTFYEGAGNVVIVGKGTINTAALSFPTTPTLFSNVWAQNGLVYIGPGGAAQRSTTGAAVGPTTLGAGPTIFYANSSTGPVVGISALSNVIFIPPGYVSGTSMTSTSIYNGRTFASMGLTPGTYVWNWGAGPTADSLTVQFSAGLPPLDVTATKTVSGSFTPGSTATYTVVLTNAGPGVQLNNPGNEYVDVLPAGVTLVGSTATSGATTNNFGTNTFAWNGSIAAGSSVTLTITATVNPAAAGTVVSSQGTVSFDADADGTNESTIQTDDPGVIGAANPTNFTVVALPPAAPVAAAAIPTLSEWAVVLMSALLAMLGIRRVRRRN